MELSQKFLDTLTDEQRELLEVEEAMDSKAAFEKYIKDREAEERHQAEAADHLRSMML